MTTESIKAPDSIKLRLRYKCCICGNIASFTMRRKPVPKFDLVIDTSKLRCEKCYSGARAEAFAQFDG